MSTARILVEPPACRRCQAPMQPGIAIGQTVVGEPEWPNAPAVTLNHGGPGRLIECWKCPACGWSVTK